MEIHATAIDRREKRWFDKVARRAERAVNQLIGAVGGDTRFEVHALFDTAE